MTNKGDYSRLFEGFGTRAHSPVISNIMAINLHPVSNGKKKKRRREDVQRLQGLDSEMTREGTSHEWHQR
jgi:hypothetical protein